MLYNNECDITDGACNRLYFIGHVLQNVPDIYVNKNGFSRHGGTVFGKKIDSVTSHYIKNSYIQSYLVDLI